MPEPVVTAALINAGIQGMNMMNQQKAPQQAPRAQPGNPQLAMQMLAQMQQQQGQEYDPLQAQLMLQQALASGMSQPTPPPRGLLY